MAFSMQVPHGRPSCSLHPSSSQQHVPLQSRMPVPLVFENRFSTPSTCAAAVLYGRDGMKRQLCCCSAVPPSQPTGTAAGPASKPPASKKDGAQADLANKLASATSAKDKLEVLEQLGARSKNALTQSGMYGAGAPRMVDARMYATALESQRKLSQKLTDANAYITFLEQKVEKYGEELQAAAETLKKASMEYGTTGRLAQAAAAAVRFGVDKEDAVAKIGKLKERLDALEKAMLKEREDFSKRVPRKVPVTWVGSANEVKLVGDFDNWTRGIDLGIPDMETDGVLRTFEATVQLLPGKYRVKFMVDGEWRLAPDWPMEKDAVGETNNVLEIK